MSSTIPAANARKKVNLWVEDLDTRAYLVEVWDDPDFEIKVAGGVNAVFGVVKDARDHGATNTFGLVDRDMKRSNRSSWLKPASAVTVFIPEAHEVECHALSLDDQVVAALDPNLNPRRRTSADMISKARSVADGGTWWMALRCFADQVDLGLVKGFPKMPKRYGPNGTPIPDLAAAEAFVAANLSSGPWIASLDGERALLNDSAQIRDRLQHHERRYADSLRGDDWRTLFSGKEMYTAMASHTYLMYNPGGSDIELLQGIGRAQRIAGRVPQELQELRTSLRRRCGLEPWPDSP